MEQFSQQTNTINTIINKFEGSKFTDSSKLKKLADVENALNGQVKHLGEITKLRDKINSDLSNNSNKFTNSGAAQSIINKYLNFIDYIIALINAKIEKDNAMTALLTNTFKGVNTFIGLLEGSKEKLTSKNITEKILQNIGINDKDLKFKISNLGLKNAEKVGLNIDENEMIEQNSIKGLVTKIIENCQTKLTKSIEGFTIQLGTIIEDKSKAGGNGNPNTSPNGSFQNLSNANLIVPDGENLNKYQKLFKDIKDNYEKGLQDNIIAYREICKILLSEEQNSPGILKIIIDSVNGLNVVNKEITKRFGFKLDLFQDEPFAANKTAFEELKEEINAAKKELSNTSVQENPQVSVVDGPVGEKIKDGSQPLKESFQTLLENLEGESNNEILDAYKASLLESLQNINSALNDSISEEGITHVNTTFPHHYIAYDFGWKDPIKDNSGSITRSGDWKVKIDGKKPTNTINDFIRVLELSTSISKDELISITKNMIILLENEKPSTAEKSASQGTNNSGFRNTQNSFKPKIPQQTVGGYKNKSKSKKMASKKTSMKVAKKTSSKAKENKNKKIVKSYSKSKSKKQSGGFIRGGVLFPQDFYDTSTVM